MPEVRTEDRTGDGARGRRRASKPGSLGAALLAALLACALAPAVAAASAVTSVAVRTDSASAQARDDLYTATFTSTHALASETGYVQLKAATGAVFVDVNTYYAFTDGSHSALPARVVTDPAGAGENVVDLYVPSSFSVAAGDKVEVSAYGVANPSAANSAATFSVSTSSDTEAVSKSLPITAATAVTEAAASVSPSSAGATRAVYTESFKATDAITVGNPDYFDEAPGYIQLTLPAGVVAPASTVDYAIVDGSDSGIPSGLVVNPGGAGENVVDLYIPDAVPIAAGDKVEVQAFAVKNPGSADASASVSVATSSDAAPVSKTVPITAASAISELAVGANTHAAAAHEVEYTVSFKAASAMTVGNRHYFDEAPGYVKLVLPAGTQAPTDLGDYRVTDGSSSACPPGITVDPGGAGAEVVEVQLPFAVAAGDKVEVGVYGATNPATQNASASVTASTSSDVTAVSKGLAITAETSVASPHSKRDATGYVEQFVTAGALSEGNPISFREGAGYLKFVAPSGVTLPASRSEYEVTAGGSSYVPSSVEVSGNTAIVYVAQAVPAGTAVTLTVSGLTRPPGGEVQLSTSSDAKPVSVATTGGEGTPAVTDVTPHSGSPEGGTSVTITGSGLGEATAVKFGSTAAASFHVASSTQITAVSPAGTGTVDVTVESPEGTSATSTADRFTYVSGGAPQFGRCAKTASGAGRFKSATCTSERAGSDYEFTPGAAKPSVSFSGGAAKLETAAKQKLECKSVSGSGAYDSSREIDAVELVFSGCEAAGTACSSEGAAAGEIRSSQLEALLGYEQKAKKKLGLDFFPDGHLGDLLVAHCGSATWTIRGSVIAPIKADKAATATVLKLAASKGKQKIQHLEGEAADVLEASLGGAYEAVGLTASVTLTSQEAIEANALF